MRAGSPQCAMLTPDMAAQAHCTLFCRGKEANRDRKRDSLPSVANQQRLSEELGGHFHMGFLGRGGLGSRGAELFLFRPSQIEELINTHHDTSQHFERFSIDLRSFYPVILNLPLPAVPVLKRRSHDMVSPR